MPIRRVCLSFKVESITERLVAEESGEGVAIYDTMLCCINGNGRIMIRGNPWPVGTKVDFDEIPIDHGPRHPLP